MQLLMAHGQRLSKEYAMIFKEEKLFIINGYLKSLGAEKIMLNDRITSDLTQEEIAEINLSINSIDQKIQAIESEKTKIEEGE
jgi:hypothetical protein